MLKKTKKARRMMRNKKRKMEKRETNPWKQGFTTNYFNVLISSDYNDYLEGAINRSIKA